jgi:TetR/AcrR family transcriptional repressor of nem operon
LDRVFGRLDFALASTGGAGDLTKGCLFGMFAQELAFTNPELRDACQVAFLSTAADVERDLAEAKALHAPKIDFDPKKVALFYVSTIQGGLIMAKAGESNAVLRDNIEQFRSYVQGLFGAVKHGKSATAYGTFTSNS